MWRPAIPESSGVWNNPKLIAENPNNPQNDELSVNHLEHTTGDGRLEEGVFMHTYTGGRGRCVSTPRQTHGSTFRRWSSHDRANDARCNSRVIKPTYGRYNSSQSSCVCRHSPPPPTQPQPPWVHGYNTEESSYYCSSVQHHPPADRRVGQQG